MRINIQIIISVIVMSFVFTSCGTNNDVQTSSKNVYIPCGESYGSTYSNSLIYASLWNGTNKTTLTDPKSLINSNSWATSVFVSDNDVYVVGQISGTVNYAILWKNGVQTILPFSIANSVYVSGNDVYIAGQNNSSGSQQTAVLWKNGTLTQLQGGVNANYVYVNGTDVYVAGSGSTADNYTMAILWKNGVENQMSKNSISTAATSVFISGNDIYVGGLNNYVNNGGTLANLWKNNVAVQLPAGAEQVYVIGNDVYTAAIINNCLIMWKNGIKTTLYQAEKYTSVGLNAINVSGSDVYVLGSIGSTLQTEKDNMHYVLWKNGLKTDLSIHGNSMINSIFVK